MTVQLNLIQQPAVPLEAEAICPDRFAELSEAEIGALTVYHGKRQVPLSEFFDVSGGHSDQLVLTGDLNKVRWVGRMMSRGSIVINGDVGMHLGAYMKGGRIDVHGNAGDWVGGEMKNGRIHVRGYAGGQIGAAYRGSRAGMRNGLIMIDGSAGLEVGMRMRRGTIVLGGLARDFCGLQMKGGTIILKEGAEIRTGSWMTRGTIISLKPLQLMPTFNHANDYDPTFLRIYARQLKQEGVELPIGNYQRFTGDTSVPGKGEILVWQNS